MKDSQENKIKRVSYHKWKKGQKLEKEYHDTHNSNFNDGWILHKNFYRQYFKYLEIDKDLKYKSILEIGPANFPMLGYCKNLGGCYVIEPIVSEYLNKICFSRNIKILTTAAEYLKFPEVDEIWLCNVLQHVINPDLIILKSKESAKVIRFFEPVNSIIDSMHHWTFDLDYFKNYFGDCVKHYKNHPKAVYSHKHECAYGFWSKK